MCKIYLWITKRLRKIITGNLRRQNDEAVTFAARSRESALGINPKA